MSYAALCGLVERRRRKGFRCSLPCAPKLPNRIELRLTPKKKRRERVITREGESEDNGGVVSSSASGRQVGTHSRDLYAKKGGTRLGGEVRKRA